MLPLGGLAAFSWTVALIRSRVVLAQDKQLRCIRKKKIILQSKIPLVTVTKRLS